MNRVQLFRRILLAWSVVATMLGMASCESGLIFEGEGDCGVYYRIRFKYDYNIKFADAFAHEVNSIALYVFDENDILVQEIATTEKAALASGTFEIPLELLPGRYTLLAWGGLMEEESFDLLPTAVKGMTTRQEMQVKMRRLHNYAREACVSEDLLPLFHGTMPLEVVNEPGTHTKTLSLVKNTNNVRILLHEMSGHDVDADKFRFEIHDSNGLYDWDNTLLDDEQIIYEAWYQTTGSADMEEYATRTITEVNVVLAELTIGRMRADSSPILHIISRETGEDVVRLPLADYALLVKGYYRESMSDQEYLDRQDEYSLTLFLDEGEWVSSMIYINSWRVVINDSSIK
jgi:hypothetical protein